MFLTRSLKKLYEFTVILRFRSQLIPKKGDVYRMIMLIEVRGEKFFFNINRNNVNRAETVRN